MSEISELWQRIEDWYTRQDAVHLLNASATEAELLAAEKELGFRLPADLRESFARHNGSAPHGWPYGQLLSLAQILEKYKELAKEWADSDDDDVEYTETERAELARLAEDILLPVETASDGTTLLELSVVGGIGVWADESCATVYDTLNVALDELQLGNHQLHRQGDFLGLLTAEQVQTLEAGANLEQVLGTEEENVDEQLNSYLRDFLNDLDAIAEEHGELGDTETREQMTDALVLSFLKPKAGYVLPADLGMFSDEANAKVRAALGKYVAYAGARAAALGLNTPSERLRVLNAEVYSDEGNCGDEYFAWLESVE